VTSPLENLVRVGKLHVATHTDAEHSTLLGKSIGMLRDAKVAAISLQGRFTLAYGAAHGFALAALWRRGYRSEDRYTVFATLVHTTSISHGAQRVLVNAHRTRNQMEYEADDRLDEGFLASLIAATEELARSLGGT
jgi:hypothetical protein